MASDQFHPAPARPPDRPHDNHNDDGGRRDWARDAAISRLSGYTIVESGVKGLVIDEFILKIHIGRRVYAGLIGSSFYQFIY